MVVGVSKRSRDKDKMQTNKDSLGEVCFIGSDRDSLDEVCRLKNRI